MEKTLLHEETKIGEKDYKVGDLLFNTMIKSIYCVFDYDFESGILTLMDANEDYLEFSSKEALNDYVLVGNAEDEETFLSIVRIDSVLWETFLNALIFKCFNDGEASIMDWRILYDNIWAASYNQLLEIHDLIKAYNDVNAKLNKECIFNQYNDFVKRVSYFLTEHEQNS